MGADPLSRPVQYGCQLRGDRSWNSRMSKATLCGGVVALTQLQSERVCVGNALQLFAL